MGLRLHRRPAAAGRGRRLRHRRRRAARQDVVVGLPPRGEWTVCPPRQRPRRLAPDWRRLGTPVARDAMSYVGRQLADWLVPRLHGMRALRAVGKKLLRHRVIKQPFHSGVICMDAVQHSWAWTGTYRLDARDAPVQDRLLALSHDCETMLDIGSNLGTMAISVALRNPRIRIVCIEPNARACELLRQSVRLNNLTDRVSVVEAVVGDADGDIGFEEGGSTTGHVAAGAAISKPMIDFAQFGDEHSAHGRCVIKIDIEGFESTLLKEVNRFRYRRNVALLVELHAHGFNRLGDPRFCVELLRDAGAVVTNLEGLEIAAVDSWTDPVQTLQIQAHWVDNGEG